MTTTLNGHRGYVYPLAVKLEMRNSYVRGNGTLRKLCLKMGVNYYTALGWHRAEKWAKMRRVYFKKQEDKFSTDDAPAPSTLNGHDSGNFLNDGKSVVEERIKETTKALAQSRSGKEMRDLAVSLKLLWDTWSLITGHPKPGTRRQSRKGQGARPVSEFVPLDEQPGPEPADPPAE